MAIGRLEQYVEEWGMVHAEELRKAEAMPANGKKVAVVGSGPAGLTCGIRHPGASSAQGAGTAGERHGGGPRRGDADKQCSGPHGFGG